LGTKLRVTQAAAASSSPSTIVAVHPRRVLGPVDGAARAIGLTGAGVGRVTAEVVPKAFSLSPFQSVAYVTVAEVSANDEGCRREMTAGFLVFLPLRHSGPAQPRVPE